MEVKLLDLLSRGSKEEKRLLETSMVMPITGWATARVTGKSEGCRRPHAMLSLRWALCLQEQGGWNSRVLLAAETWGPLCLAGMLAPSLTGQQPWAAYPAVPSACIFSGNL